MHDHATLRAELEAAEVQLLEQAIQRGNPSLAKLLDMPLADLSRSDMNRLQEAVGVLLVTQGFEEDWEPNPRGLACEDLIDRLAPWNWARTTTNRGLS